MIPTPKEEPVLYAALASWLSGLAARYGFHVDSGAVLTALGAVATVVTALLARRRTVAVHPSTGDPVKVQ